MHRSCRLKSSWSFVDVLSSSLCSTVHTMTQFYVNTSFQHTFNADAQLRRNLSLRVQPRLQRATSNINHLLQCLVCRFVQLAQCANGASVRKTQLDGDETSSNTALNNSDASNDRKVDFDLKQK